MRRLSAWIGPAIGLVLLLYCYRAALFQGEQFGFRDAAHYYYPLYHKVQAEWAAGRVPLWDAGENAGMPLLGNPTDAVLYPGKLIYAALPYPLAARLYAVAHTALAFAGMMALMRSWGTSRPGSTIAALGYAFGGPVLFQYCNIIFLVGAAWTPWGLRAVDRWLRLGRPGALAELAVVLAMQVLGGDPESAYLTGLCAGGYAIGMAWAGRGGRPRIRARTGVLIAASGVVAWVAITLGLAYVLPGFRPEPKEPPWGAFGRWLASGKVPSFRPLIYEGPVPSFPWAPTLPIAVAGVWGIAGLAMVARWLRRGPSASPLVPGLAGLAGAAVLAGALSAAQLLPVLEFTRISGRATDEGAHDIYPFSLEPYRLVEAAWPGVFGRQFGRPVQWSDMVLPLASDDRLPALNHKSWVPSLYLGGLTLALAVGAAGFRGGPPWRGWLTGIAAVSLIGSFGEFASPLLIARLHPDMARALGPNDERNTNAVRLDGHLRDGDGSPYCLMAALVPGFHTFRFPSKLLSFTALAVAGLAGLGWDRGAGGRSRRPSAAAWLGALLSIGVLIVLDADPGRLLARFEARPRQTIFGPFDAAGAVSGLRAALIQGALALSAAGGLLALARRRPGLAGPLAVLALAVDLAVANAPLVRTVPQSEFETSSAALEKIAEAERADPSDGPYRVHRMPIWQPARWMLSTSDDRIRDFVRWESDTLQPKYGLLHGVEYTYTLGVTELYDYAWFFSPFRRAVRSEAARFLGVRPGDKVVVYPRRGFDLWNSRYFILPARPVWLDADRGIASFLLQTDPIYPPPGALRGRGDEARVRRRIEDEDFQILRNKNAFPRAWVVHGARFSRPIAGLTRADRKGTMEEILFDDDPLWTDAERTRHDPRRIAWIEADDQGERALAGFLPGPKAGDDDSVKVIDPGADPLRVVLDADLARPGLVILADIFFPGWQLTIDGEPAPILRANRAMRGAAVPSGRHRLVYTYRPRSFRFGAMISLAGLVGLAGFTAWASRRGRRPTAAPTCDFRE